MVPVATLLQSADHAVTSANHAILWVVLFALVNLAASFASIWRSFVHPKEYATLRELHKLEARFEKHIEDQREEEKSITAKLESIRADVMGKLDEVRQDVTKLHIELEKRT